jgi:hypothetical protein
MNTWMNNPQYLAQVGHFLGGASLIMLTVMFSWNPLCIWATFGVGVVAAGVKEFWYDANYELPKQTWQDNLMDFSFYVLGGLVGVGISYGAMHVHRFC